MAKKLTKKQREAKRTNFWDQAPSAGRPTMFSDPDHMWACAVEYFQWVEENPLLEERLFHYQGNVSRESISKMRAMTVSGLCIFVGMSEGTWHNYSKDDTFLGVTSRIASVMRNQKFTGAAADMLNANIIAGDLGLADKKELSGDIENPLTLIISEISGNTLGPAND